jgi:hypothetical protein
MKALFCIWGGVGFFVNIVASFSLFDTKGVGVGTSAYVIALASIWIGGMLLFGFGSILFRTSTSDINLSSAARVDDNPYPSDSPQGKAWSRGITDRAT